MTSPRPLVPSPWLTDAKPGRATRLLRTRRILDQVTVIAVLAIIGVATVATLVVGREGFSPAPQVAKMGLERALRQRGYAVGPADTTSRYAPKARETEGPSLFEKLFPAPVTPHHDDGVIGPVIALERLVLLERAEQGAPAVTTVEAGEVVMAGKQRGDWILIAVILKRDTVFGWAHSEQVRPLGSRLRGGR